MHPVLIIVHGTIERRRIIFRADEPVIGRVQGRDLPVVIISVAIAVTTVQHTIILRDLRGKEDATERGEDEDVQRDRVEEPGEDG